MSSLRKRPSQAGYSMMEVMVASSIMMVVVLGVYELIVNVNKSAGDIERRGRFHDLVDDIRFTFSQPALCAKSVRPAMWTEGAEVEVDLNDKTVAKAKAQLNDYGVVINHLVMRDVTPLPLASRTLVTSNDEVLARFEEADVMANIFIDASPINGKQPYRTLKVARVLHYARKGDFNEIGCVSSHDVIGKGLAASTDMLQEMMHIAKSSSAENGAQNVDAVVSGGVSPSAPGQQPAITGNRSEKDCDIDDPEARKLTGRVRMANGEVLHYTNSKNQMVALGCVEGKISVFAVDQGTPLGNLE
jgi:Prokaryotic N-terminal methylation motif